MATADCIRLIREAAGAELSEDDITEVVEELQRRLDVIRATDDLRAIEERMFDEADAFALEIEEAARIEKRNRLINIKVENEFKSFAKQVSAATDDPSLALKARNVGVNAQFVGARRSVDARGLALENEYLGGMVADLRREDLLRTLNGKTIDREIARELAELSKRGGNFGLTGNKDAQKIARVIDKYRRASVARENRAGAWIKPLEGYVVRQSHDIHRIRRAGYDEWRSSILPLLDPVKTFGGKDPEKVLEGAYNGIVTGRHITAQGEAETDLGFAFKGPGNLAKRASEHRLLHFRDADAWFDYNEQFGMRSLIEAVIGDMQRAARNTALMEAWGTNPRAMFDKVREQLLDETKGDVRKFDKVKARSVEHQFAEVMGENRIPGNISSAYIGSTVRAVESMSKLGGATLSAISDVAFKAAELRYQGSSTLDSWGRALTTTVEGFSTTREKKAVADLIGVGLEGQIGDLAARFSATDSLPGRMAKLQQRFFKLNLLAPWTDANDRGVGLMMARDLAMKKSQGWDGLDDATRNILGLYGIDAGRWNIVRKAARKEADGREYIMPDAIREIADEELGASGRKAQALRDELETALRSYYVDRVNFAIPKPGARERAFMTQGTQPGTALGEAVRFVMQFKAFPITALSKVFGREARADSTADFFRNLLAGKADVTGLVNTIVGTTVLGYVAQSAKELAKGRSARDPGDPQTWVAAMLQGGGLGIYGDFIFGEFNRYGRSALATAAGPTLGTADDLIELWARFREGEDAAASAVRFTLSNTPYLNLFYTRAALDYLILYQLQEAASPGYLRRMERRVKKENKQTFVLPPSRLIPRGGGGQMFESVR